MNILVVGGAGYIGSHVVYELTRVEGNNIIVLDNLSTGNIEAVHKQVKFYEGDQRDSQILEKVFTENKIDVVMHFSAKLIVPESVDMPLEYYDNNVFGVIALLKAMKTHNVKNIVFSSTAAVYGDVKGDKPLVEELPKEPINPYGQSKLMCEKIIQDVSKAEGFNFCIFRYFNVAGADKSGEIGQATKGRQLTHLLPVIIESLEGVRDKMTIFGDDYETRDGTCVRDYIHVSDLAKSHILGAKHVMGDKSGIFNLGYSQGVTVMEMVKEVEKVTERKVPYEIGPRRDGDPAILVASNVKATNDLGFKKEEDLESMIKSDLNWRKTHPKGF